MAKRDDICYHHFSLTFEPGQVSERFRDVRFVLVAGCPQRAQSQAVYLQEHLFNGLHSGIERRELERLTGPTSRFALFKVGPVLISNHGMGAASMSIALHELFLMCMEAKVLDKITMIRFGTCGGIGVNPGTVCVTTRALDPLFQDFIELKICLKLVRRPCVIDMKTAQLLEELAREFGHSPGAVEELGEFEVRSGATVDANDFYEEQGRTNGAICEHSQEDKMKFLNAAREIGVINMEMESNHLAAMCHKLNVAFGIICVALNNRLLDDRVHLSRSQMSLYERRLFWLNSTFIKHKLSI